MDVITLSQVKKVKSETDNLKNLNGDIQNKITGSNLNDLLINYGYYDRGSLVSLDSSNANGWKYTRYISINKLFRKIKFKAYGFYFNSTSVWLGNINYFDKNKKIIGYVGVDHTTVNVSSSYEKTVAIPSNAAYIVFGTNINNLNVNDTYIQFLTSETIAEDMQIYTYNLGQKDISVIGDSMAHGTFCTATYNDSWVGILRNLFALEFGKKLNYGFVSFNEIEAMTVNPTWWTNEMIHVTSHSGWSVTWNSNKIYGNAMYYTSGTNPLSWTVRKKFNYMKIAHMVGEYGTLVVKAGSTTLATIDCSQGTENCVLSSAIDISTYDVGTVFSVQGSAGTVAVSGVQFIDDVNYPTFNNWAKAGIGTGSITVSNLFDKYTNADTIIFELGYNDNTQALFEAAIDSYITLLKTKKCNIIIVDTCWNYDTNSWKRAKLRYMAESLANAIYIPFPDIVPRNTDRTIITGFLAADGVHPTNEGHQFMAEYIARVMKLSIRSKLTALDVLGMRI